MISERDLAQCEFHRQATEIGNSFGPYMEILEECFAEVTTKEVSEDRLELLQNRFDLIVDLVRERARDFLGVAKELGEF